MRISRGTSALPVVFAFLLAVASCGCAASTSMQSSGSSVGVGATTSGSDDVTRAPAGGGDPLLPGTLLLVDRADLRLGTTVQLARVPSVRELHDLTYETGLARVVVTLGAWPEYETLVPLDQTPEGIELVVVLTGYPPSRAAAEAWEHLRVPVRVIVVVAGPPPSRGEIDDLNVMRGLERVIGRMAQPSRAGFERLQRPLSFWKVVE